MRIVLLVALLLLVGCSQPDVPVGKFKRWQTFWSKVEDRRVYMWEFQNGWFEDVKGVGNPFDAVGYPEFVRPKKSLMDEKPD